MYKKVFISFLLLTLINFIAGCSSFHSVSISEYKQIEEEEGKPTEIYVKTKANQWYHFTNSNYYIENDTLFGKAKVMVRDRPFEGKFALAVIKTIQVEYFASEYSSPITVSQYQKVVTENGKPDEIYLTKNDDNKYHFMKTDYYIENDTLYGKGKLILDREELINKNIALSDIESMGVEGTNWITSSYLGFGIFITLLGVIFIIWLFSQILGN